LGKETGGARPESGVERCGRIELLGVGRFAPCLYTLRVRIEGRGKTAINSRDPLAGHRCDLLYPLDHRDVSGLTAGELCFEGIWRLWREDCE